MRKLSVSIAVLMFLAWSVAAWAGTSVPKKVQIVDPANDANGVNDQVVSSFADASFGDVAAATTIPQADILKVWFSHTNKDITAHIQTAAPLPAPVPLFFMIKSNPSDAQGARLGCVSLYAAVETDIEEAEGGDCASGLRPAKARFQELPDGTGVLEITVTRMASVEFMSGKALLSPRAFSQHTTYRSMGMIPANVPVIDNTKAGKDYKLP